MINHPKKILIMAGGTGGHIFPAMAVADQLKADGMTVEWLGTRGRMEEKIVPPHYPIHYINIQGLRGKSKATLLLAPFKMMNATSQALRVIRKVKPDLVLGMGGFVTGPGGMAAKLAGVPMIIHEQNALPGMTNKILARLAKKVYSAFPNTFHQKHKAIAIGNPVRADFINQALPEERFQNRTGPLRLFVAGGSQGAKFLNDLIFDFHQFNQAQENPLALDIILQCGQSHFESLSEKLNNQTITLKPFIDDMAAEYAAADIILCRAGAMTVSEIAVVGVPAIFVPLPIAVDDHQYYNAKYLADNGAAIIVRQHELEAKSLHEIISEHQDRQLQLLPMAIKAREMAEPEAVLKLKMACAGFGF